MRPRTQTKRLEKGTSMSVFKDLADSKEKRKAKAFYDQVVTLSKTSKDSRKLRALIGNRSKAFFDQTFVEGAKKTETHQKAKEAGNKTAVLPASLKISSPYKQVKTINSKSSYSKNVHFNPVISLYILVIVGIEILHLFNNSSSLKIDSKFWFKEKSSKF